jgi:MAP/microtubule affinity-regulating kinase
MSTVLEVNPGEIKETVRRDRCDWLAAIYNLLIDQPEGRNIIQRLIMDDPEEQLVDAAHYQGSMEHFRLSQGGKAHSCSNR